MNPFRLGHPADAPVEAVAPQPAQGNEAPAGCCEVVAVNVKLPLSTPEVHIRDC